MDEMLERQMTRASGTTGQLTRANRRRPSASTARCSTPVSQFYPARAASCRRVRWITSGRRFETEAVVAEILLQLPDPPPNEGSGFARTGNIDRLAIATELKDRVACVRAHVAEHPLYRCEVPVRRETDRLRPRGNIAQQLAGVARIDGNHGRPGIRRVHVHLENFASLMPRQNTSIRNEL